MRESVTSRRPSSMPLYPLSFSEEFFSGEGDPYEVEPSNHPTSVLQAAISIPFTLRAEIAREVFGLNEEVALVYADDEGFAFDLVERVRETDLCDGYESPITVYIDEDQNYS